MISVLQRTLARRCLVCRERVGNEASAARARPTIFPFRSPRGARGALRSYIGEASAVRELGHFS